MTVREIVEVHPQQSKIDPEVLLRCVDVCEATGRVVTRLTEPDLHLIASTVEACAVACRVCREECERHAAHHEHCRRSAAVCLVCEQACTDLLAAIG